MQMSTSHLRFQWQWPALVNVGIIWCWTSQVVRNASPRWLYQLGCSMGMQSSCDALKRLVNYQDAATVAAVILLSLFGRLILPSAH
jgi:hypothetical protein